MLILKPSKIIAYCNVEFEYQISIYPTTEESHKKNPDRVGRSTNHPENRCSSKSYKNPQFLRHREHSVPIRKAKLLMLFRERTHFYYDCHKEHVILWGGRDAEILNVQAGGAYKLAVSFKWLNICGNGSNHVGLHTTLYNVHGH